MRSEQGNLFVIILLGVILFAALAMTFTRGTQSTNTSKLSQKQAQMIAQQMIYYSNKVARRVDYLSAKGCSETEFNFNAPVDQDDYTNPNAPGDGSCDIFARIRPLDPFEIGGISEEIIWASISTQENWFIRASGGVPANVGPTDTTKADLTLWTWYVKDEVCIAINNILGIENPNNAPPVDTEFINGGVSYNGTIGISHSNRIANTTGGEIDGKEAACFFDNDNASGGGGEDRNYFYRVLMAN